MMNPPLSDTNKYKMQPHSHEVRGVIYSCQLANISIILAVIDRLFISEQNKVMKLHSIYNGPRWVPKDNKDN